jgi:hypothetical protein
MLVAFAVDRSCYETSCEDCAFPMRDGIDFNNQFNFSNTDGPSLLDQRHRISFAGVYRPRLDRLTSSHTVRAILSWLEAEQSHGVFFGSSVREFVKPRMH